MAKKQIEVCEICKKDDCSGNVFWAYDECNDKLLWVCESQTELKIRVDVYNKAVVLLEEENPNAKYNDVSITSKKYIIKAAKLMGLPFVPVARYYHIECGNTAIAMPKAWKHPQYKMHSGHENLFIPFAQLAERAIYNNGCNKLEGVGKN